MRKRVKIAHGIPNLHPPHLHSNIPKKDLERTEKLVLIFQVQFQHNPNKSQGTIFLVHLKILETYVVLQNIPNIVELCSEDTHKTIFVKTSENI